MAATGPPAGPERRGAAPPRPRPHPPSLTHPPRALTPASAHTAPRSRTRPRAHTRPRPRPAHAPPPLTPRPSHPAPPTPPPRSHPGPDHTPAPIPIRPYPPGLPGCRGHWCSARRKALLENLARYAVALMPKWALKRRAK
ncbi:hypothetical protein GCM10023259_072990 [Thermocatellispora tengchongensis]